MNGERRPGFLERTGVARAMRHFLREQVPSRGGWLFTLGSALLAVLGLQFLTGALLATSYAPTPDHARASILFLERHIDGGSLVRALHHWGATAAVILVLLHLVRVFVHAAYKSPRQETWATGLLSAGLILAFGFTGYLLPWDQKGYWATVVGVRLIGSVPLAGPLLARLLAGTSRVGAVSLSRFAAIHIAILPIAAIACVAAHIILLRRHGHAKLPNDASPREDFAPRQLARDLAVILLVFGILAAISIAFPAPLEAPADPTDTSYVPRPDWYFLPLFELLHIFSGSAGIAASLAVGAGVAIFLFLLPFLDRSEHRRPERRPVIVIAGTLVLTTGIVLFSIAQSDSPVSGSRFHTVEPPPPPMAFMNADLQNWDLALFSPAVLRGGRLIATKKCLECHRINGDGNGKGIELKHVATRRTREWLVAHFKDPQELSPHSKMPPYDDLPERDLTDIADYLLSLP